VPTKDSVSLLERAIGSILQRTTYPAFEVVVVDNRSELPETAAYFAQINSHDKVRTIKFDQDFSFSELNNWAVRQTDAPVLAFLNNDVEVFDPEWLTEMVRHVLRAQVGAVGAKLYYPDSTIQHAGIVVGIGGLAGHPHVRFGKGNPGYFGRAVCTQQFSAVSAACLLMRREVFDKVGGFNETEFAIAFNDVDLGLRLWQAGYSVVWTPYAQLVHHESASLGNPHSPQRQRQFKREAANLRRLWLPVLQDDPFYNPNLIITGGDFRPGFPTRAKKPWTRSYGP
jgi:GT2 family glycosyltransferase